jgi:signal peptidase I
MNVKSKTGWVRKIYDLTDMAVFTSVAMILLFSFVTGAFTIISSSMEDTLKVGETVMAARLHTGLKRGDIILFSRYGWKEAYDESAGRYDAILKRVIGLPGDEIEFNDGKLFINGVEQYEDYLKRADWLWRGYAETPLVVPDGKYFVMGDNRNNSNDSRGTDIGFVDRREVIGRVMFRLYPFKVFGGGFM